MRWLDSQIVTRTRLDAELTDRAYAELAASVTKSSRMPHFDAGDLEQTDSAVKMCLKYCGVEPGYVKDDIEDVAERIGWLCRPSGTMRRPVRLEKDWHKSVMGAMVARLDTGSVIALIPSYARGYTYLDPKTGKRVHVTARVASHIEPDALVFYRPLPTGPLKVSDLVKFVFSVFDTGDYVTVAIAAVAVTLIGFIPPQANKIAFDIVVPSGDVRLVAPICALLLGVAIATVLIGMCRNLVMARLSTKLQITAEAATFSRVMLLSPSFFKQYSSGDLASRVANVSTLCQMIASVVLGSFLSVFLSFAFVIQIGMYAPVLALPSLIIALLQVGSGVVLTRMNMRFEERAVKESVKISGVVTALLNGIQKIKLAGAENRAFAKWAKGYAEYARANYNRPALLRALPAVVTLIGMLGTILIYYLAGTSGVTIASFMAFNVAFGQMNAAIMEFTNSAVSVSRIKPMLDMIAPILETAPEIDDDKPSVDNLSGGIEVSKVYFRYGQEFPYVLRDISFSIRPGEYVALVGKSGCGKSTIIRLLLGFEQPERGSVFYGKYNVQKIDLQSLRQHIGVVMQDGRLLMGDIQNNILISTPQATIDDAWEAAEIAGIADDIRKMPMGMKTLVTEGSGGVSGGQRQRLMIARAVCGNRKILLFDEATSALDNVTQKHVIDSLGKLRCTRLVVAHRLSTVQDCDRILVMDEGRIVEEGTYDQLLESNGVFAELVRRQRLE